MRLFGVIFFILLSSQAFAESVGGSTSHNTGTNDSREMKEFLGVCVDVCLQMAQKDSPELREYFGNNCREAKKQEDAPVTVAGGLRFTGKILDQAILQCLPMAVVKAAKGAVDLAKQIPTLLAYLWSSNPVGSARDVIAERNAWHRQCAQMMPCQVGVARLLIRYREIKPEGGYTVSDETVEADIKKQYSGNFNGLITEARHQFEATRRECSSKIGLLRSSVGRGGPWSVEKHMLVFNRLNQESPYCIAALNLKEPKHEEASKEAVNPKTPFEKLSFEHQIVVGKTCLRDKFDQILVDSCGEGVQNLVPLPLLGPQTRHAVMLGKRAREAAAALEKGAVTGVSSATRSAEAVAADAKNRAEHSATAFIRQYANKIFASVEQNRRFIKIAEASNNAAANRARTRFFDVENSMMKKLNDKTGDKDLVTALTNYHKELIESRLRNLRQAHPNIQFELYSDFKSMKIAMQSATDISPEVHNRLLKELSDIYRDSNTQFATKMRELGVNVAEAGPPEKWFRAGFGAGADETSLAARNARKLDDPQIVDATSREFTDDIKRMLEGTENSRRQLAESSRFRTLFDGGVPREDVFDLVRKANSSEELAEAIRKRYKLNSFTEADANQLLRYTEQVNDFSPAIYIAKRENVTLESAAHGGLSADFLGWGSANLRASAEGLAKQSDVGSAILSVRRAEQAVTQTFQTRKEQFQRIAGGNVTCSGDDCVKIAERLMTSQQKAEIMNRLAANPDTQQVRISFIGQGVKQEHRMRLATDGELIEKSLRKHLEGVIDFEKSRHIVFGLDMQATRLNQGTVNLIIGKPATVRLSSAEQQRVHSAFVQALDDYNKQTRAYNPGSTQARVMQLRLVPAAGIITNNEETSP